MHLRIKEAVREAFRDIVSVLKYPVLIGLFFLEGFTVFLAMALAFITPQYGVLVRWLFAAGSWGLMNSPIIYKVWRKVREEDSKAKAMQIPKEGWEGTEDTAKAVKEYQDLLSRQRKRHKK